MKEELILGVLALGAGLIATKKKPAYQAATSGGVIGKSTDQALTDRFEAEQALEQFEFDLASELNIDVIDVQEAFTLETSDSDEKTFDVSFDPSKLNLQNTTTFSDNFTIGASHFAEALVGTLGNIVTGFAKSLSPVDFSKTIGGIFGKARQAIENIRGAAQGRNLDRSNPIQGAVNYDYEQDYFDSWSYADLYSPDFDFDPGGYKSGGSDPFGYGGFERGSDEEAGAMGVTGFG